MGILVSVIYIISQSVILVIWNRDHTKNRGGVPLVID